MNPYLSIIVPVYNVQNYLKKCIESILIQSFQDFELILVNDGSTDDSGKICNEYLLQDRRVKVIHKSNGGLGDARNAGIIDSIGEFIGFVDSDDWIDSDMYQVLINLQIQHKSDIVSCNYMRTDTSKIDDSLKIVNYSRDEALNDLYSNKSIKWIVCNKIYKSSLFNDLLFEKVVILEDVLITPQLLYKTKKVTHIDKSLYIYNIREGSIIKSGLSVNKFNSSMYVFNKLSCFFDERDKSIKYLADEMFCSSLINWCFRIDRNKLPKGDFYGRLKKLLRLHFTAFILNPLISKKLKLLVIMGSISLNFVTLYGKFGRVK